MAFFKESERTLRAYFIFVGVIATLWALFALSMLFGQGRPGNLPKVIPPVVMLANLLPALARLVLGPVFVIAGLGLKRALETGAPWIQRLVKIAGAIIIAEAFLLAAAANSVASSDKAAELTGEAIGGAVIPLLLLWYIHANLKRLTNESRRAIVDSVAGKFD